MTKIGLIQFFLLFLISAAYGQKVKYKDIFALLSTKQYEQAEPFLKNYLRENTDNPNAFLYMGIIFQEKSAKNDVLKETSVAIANMDSSLLYFDKAVKMLDDREVRKNKEYYQSYNRRDLRTGEFGVKLSDIQFDIQKRMEGLKERIDKVRMVRHYFSLADTTYQRANALFLSLQRKFPSENQLYLRADEQTVADLSALAVRFDSCTKAFENYKAAASTLGKMGYDQKLTLAEIVDFTAHGREVADLYKEDVTWWDYKKFAENAREVIQKEIMPMRQHLVTYDMEINKLREKLNTDSVSVRSDLTKLIDKLLDEQLKKFDEAPLPMIVFGLKTADLEYRSTLLEHKPLRDSADVHLQIALLQKELDLLRKLDSTAAKLPEGEIEARAADYADFVSNTYSNAGVLKSYVRSLREYGVREQRKKAPLLAQYMKSLNYIVDGNDSIPLLEEIESFFRPLVITPEKYTMGVSLRDTTEVQGYFYTITASRRPEVKAFFALDKAAVKPSNLSATRALTCSDSGGQIYYILVYSENAVQERFPTTLAKVYRSDGLAWKVDHPLTFAPSQLVVSAETGELVISNGTLQTVVDKNGKVVR